MNNSKVGSQLKHDIGMSNSYSRIEGNVTEVELLEYGYGSFVEGMSI